MGKRKTEREVSMIALGIAALWLWSICLFPSAGVESPLGSPTDFHIPSWFISLFVGTGVTLLIALLPSRFCSNRAFFIMVLFGCLFQVAAVAVASLPSETVYVNTISGICTGLSIGVLWLAWSWGLVHLDVEQVEAIFVRALFFTAFGFMLIILLPTWLRVGTMLTLPVIQLGLYVLSDIAPFSALSNTGFSDSGLKRTENETPASARPVSKVGNSPSGFRPIAQTLARCLLAYALVSLTGEALRSVKPTLLLDPFWLFALGMFVAGFILLLFIKHSNRVDVFGAIRWIFPLVALGVVFATDEHRVLASLGIVLIVLGHASFEGMLRMDIIALAQRSAEHKLRIVSFGLAAISVGAATGIVVFNFLSFIGNNDRVLLYSFVLLVWMILLFFTGSKRPESRQSEPLKNEDICGLIASEYGLTPRETEILGYLIEGRSHPFIRDELCISKGTVDTHVRHIYEKMNVSSKQDLISAVKEARLSAPS